MWPSNSLRRAFALAIAAVALALAACGEEAEDNAVDATEQNTVEVGGAQYRVAIFRELNVHESPDDAIWSGSPPPAGSGMYMAVIRACAGDEAARMTDDVWLEDAFGEQFRPRPAGTDDEFEYRAEQLEPGACHPPEGSPARRTLDGSALVFQVPFDSVAERPMVLVIRAPEGDGEARVQLDL